MVAQMLEADPKQIAVEISGEHVILSVDPVNSTSGSDTNAVPFEKLLSGAPGTFR